jgi:uncharacterized protein with von Willebrand factor type A (vWA) domain
MRDISRFNEKQRQVLEKLRSGSAGAKYFHDVIVLLLDVSNSMAGEKIREARASILAFVSRVDPATSEVVLAPFSDEVTVRTLDLGDPHGVTETVNRLETAGGTALYTSLQDVYERVLREKEHQNRTIVLATDGEPTDAPKQDIERYAARLRTRGVRIVTIAIGADCDTRFLSKLASSERDVHRADTGNDLKPVYEQIADQLGLPPGR